MASAPGLGKVGKTIMKGVKGIAKKNASSASNVSNKRLTKEMLNKAKKHIPALNSGGAMPAGKYVDKVRQKLNPALRSGSVIHTGSKARPNVMNAIKQLKGPFMPR